MKPAGGVDAVDLSAGKLLWTTTGAAKPLLLAGGRLVAQAESAVADNRLRLVVLDAKGGGEELLEATVPLPEDVSVAVDDGLGTTFRTTARLREGRAVVSWRYSRQEVSGARTGPDDGVRVTAGAVGMDLETGYAEPLAPEQLAPVPEGQVPDRVARSIEPGSLRGPLWQIEATLAGIERRRGDRGWHTVLRRWQADTGQALPEAVLFGDELTFRYASANGAHLLASQRLRPPGAGWAWKIYSQETGEQVAEVRQPSPAAWFFLAGPSLFFEAPPTARPSEPGRFVDPSFKLRAIRLTNGEVLWEWPYRDTAYRGAYPPTR
jgi:hypothetical protein